MPLPAPLHPRVEKVRLGSDLRDLRRVRADAASALLRLDRQLEVVVYTRIAGHRRSWVILFDPHHQRIRYAEHDIGIEASFEGNSL